MLQLQTTEFLALRKYDIHNTSLKTELPIY